MQWGEIENGVVEPRIPLGARRNSCYWSSELSLVAILIPTSHSPLYSIKVREKVKLVDPKATCLDLGIMSSGKAAWAELEKEKNKNKTLATKAVPELK